MKESREPECVGFHMCIVKSKATKERTILLCVYSISVHKLIMPFKPQKRPLNETKNSTHVRILIARNDLATLILIVKIERFTFCNGTPFFCASTRYITDFVLSLSGVCICKVCSINTSCSGACVYKYIIHCTNIKRKQTTTKKKLLASYTKYSLYHLPETIPGCRKCYPK